VSSLNDDPRIASGLVAQMALRRQRLQGGARQVGWKVGFGAAAAKEKLRIAAPLTGFLLDGALLPSGATVSLAGWQKPVAEPEIAAYIGRDVPAGADEASARAAIAAVGPAIELADIDCPLDDVEKILSGDIFQRHVLLGPRDDARSGARLEGLRAHVTRSGQDVPVPADLEANTGAIVDTVRHVADVAAALGDGLRAGQFIICGSLTPPIFLQPSDTGIDFALDPIGSVSVRLAR
jgi:2-keto-4-pentenoate hydratase